MQGWRKRMEDSHITELDVDSNTHIFAVFDGHGGKCVAQFVKHHFISELKKNKNFRLKKFKKALIETFLRVNEMLSEKEYIEQLSYLSKKSKEEDENYQKTQQHELYNELFISRSDNNENIAMYSGCTATVCLIHNEKVYFANLGDSRIVGFKNGKSFCNTVDHKPHLDSEARRIYNANGYIIDGRVNGNLNLTRSFGDLSFKQNNLLRPENQIITAFPDITEYNIKDIDFILLACDGVWDCITADNIAESCLTKIHRGSYNLSYYLEELMNHIIAPNILTGKFSFILLFYLDDCLGCDNMTAILIQKK